MDIEYLKELVQILEKSNVNKLSIKEKNGVEITLEKSPKSHPEDCPAPRREHHLPLPAPEPLPKKMVDQIDLSKCIKSPMVGTFFQSETPDSKPFKSIGDAVEVGDTLCIIEAMKVMNEIKSDRKGVIKEILVKNGRPVEYGQPLFIII